MCIYIYLDYNILECIVSSMSEVEYTSVYCSFRTSYNFKEYLTRRRTTAKTGISIDSKDTRARALLN